MKTLCHQKSTQLKKRIEKKIVDFKKKKNTLGPYATFYFESYETMLAQVQEMLYIEKGGDEQLKDELTAYNPLVPNGKELTATLMFEIDNPVSRAAFLGKVGGIEENVYMKVDGDLIKAVPEQDVDRTSAEGKPHQFNLSILNLMMIKLKNFNLTLQRLNQALIMTNILIRLNLMKRVSTH